MEKSTLRFVLIATILASAMAFIDGSVVNVALPVIQHAFKTTSSQVQWVVEAYALFLSSLILVGGALGDKFGRKRLFLLGVTFFTISSICCGLSQSINELIIFRALQGIGGAMLVPGSLSIITAAFDDSTRSKAIGTWSAFSSITTVIGPFVGGFLVQHLSWRFAFFINVPLAIIVLILSSKYITESKDEREQLKVDYIGATLITLGLGVITYSLIQMQLSGINNIPLIFLFLLGIVFIISFVFYEKEDAFAMMPLHLFSSKTFSGSNLLTFLLYGALGGALFFLPFNLIQVQGYSPAQAGAIFIPFGITMFLLSRYMGGLVPRVGAKIMLMTGPAIAGIGFFLFARPYIGGSFWTTFFPAIIMLSLGMSITVAPLTATVMGSVKPEHSGVASGVNNAVSRVAGLLAVALLGICVTISFTNALNTRLAVIPMNNTQRNEISAQEIKLAGIAIPSSFNETLTNEVSLSIKESFVDGFRLAMIIGGFAAIASAFFSFLLIEGRGRQDEIV